MARVLEERTVYGDSGLADEWAPANDEQHHGARDLRTDGEFRAYVRAWNKAAKARFKSIPPAGPPDS